MKRVTVLGATLALLLAPLLVRLLKAQSPPPGSATHFAVSPPTLANVGFIFNFSVTTFDQSNNAAKNYAGTVHFTSTDPQAVLPPDYTFTGYDSGTHMFSATLNTPGTQTITATDAASTAVTGTSNSITVSATAPLPPPTYTLTDLGPLNITAAPSGATAFNASGQVTGFRLENFPSQVCFASAANRAFQWNNGAYTELGTLGGASSAGYGINSSSQIVGTVDLCLNNASVPRAFIWQNGTMTALDPSTNSSDYSSAFAINTNGDVTGSINHANSGVGYQPVLWKGGTAAGLTLLAPLGCQFFPNCQGKAFAINDSGQAAGWAIGTFVRGYNHAVMWDSNGQPTDLVSFGRYFNDQANAINSKGDVVGYSQLDPDVYYSIIRAAAWQSGNPQTPQDLGTIPGIDPIFGASANITDNNSSAWGINSKGDIVGISAANLNAVAIGGNGGRAFLYIPTPAPGTGGTMYDLLSLLAAGTNWRRLEAAWAINDNGQILGVGYDPNQQEHGFLLTPIITPTTTTVTTSGTPSVFGQQVSFTATLTPTQPSALTPTGNVTFSEGTTALGTVPLNSGSATFNTGTLGVGSRTITASYRGDNNFGSSASTALIQTVSPAATTTTLVASPNPSNLSQTVTLTATVTVVAPGSSTPTGPTGTVTFSDGTTTLGTAALNSAGTATFSTSSLASEGHSITASYGGDANFAGSASTATSLSVTLAPPAIASPVSGFSTTNSSVTVTGTGTFGALVAILDGSITVARIPVDPTGNFSVTTALAVGAHSLTARQTLGAATSAASAAVSLTILPQTVTITVNEGITVSDVPSFPDVFDAERVKVTDQVTVHAFFLLAISPAPPILSAVQGQPYSGVTFSGTGGYQSLTLSESGAVPGMSFTIAGTSATFSGTPTQAGAFSFTITATDSIGNNLSQNYSLVVSAACPAISVSPSGPLGAATVGSAFSQRFTAAGGIGAVVWSESGPLPTGLIFSTLATPFLNLGLLSGIPTQPGTSTVTITATDQNGCQGSSNVSIPVVPPPAVITDNETITVSDTPEIPQYDVPTVAALPVGLLGSTLHFSIMSPHVDGDLGCEETVNSIPNAIILPGTSGLTSHVNYFNLVTQSVIAFGGPPDNETDGDWSCEVRGSMLVVAHGGNHAEQGINADHGSSIYIFDTANPSVAPVLISPQGDEINLVPQIGDQTVVWQAGGVGPVSHIDVYDRPSATTQIISTGILPNGTVISSQSPEISPDGRLAVWEGCTIQTPANPTPSCVIWKATLANGAWSSQQLASTVGGDQRHPATDGSIIAYTAAILSGQQQLLVWQPAGGGTEHVLGLPGQFANPSVSNGLIAFAYQAPGTNYHDIAFYDTQFNRFYNLTAAVQPGNTNDKLLSDVSVTPDGKVRVVWVAPVVTPSGGISPIVFSYAFQRTNTSIGQNVTATIVDLAGIGAPVTVNFGNVTGSGVTSLIGSTTGAPPPPGYMTGNPTVYYDISTTATFTGLATVCIRYSGITFIQPPQLFHLENGVWVDRATSVDPGNMIACGAVASFSPFALFAPRPILTITANSVPRQYGQTNPSLNNVTYSGFVNGDTPSVLSGTLSCVSPATTASPVSIYAITCSGLSSPNYLTRYAPGVLTVTPAPLTVTAGNAQKVYGAANPVFTGAITGIQNGDNISATYATTATPASPVGTYAIAPTLVDPTGKLGNYKVTLINGKLTVIQASTTTALSVAPNPSNFGQSVTLAATVAPVAPGASTATGKVTFFDGSTTLGTSTLSSTDKATLTTSALAAGNHSLTAFYSGDPNFSGSSSSALADQVLCGVLISLSPSTVALGGTVTVSGRVISCSTMTQMVVVKFSLSGPSQPNSCSSTKSEMFTTPPFPLPPKTAQTVSFPFKVPSKSVCPGTYSITATTLINGVAVDTSTASLTITAH